MVVDWQATAWRHSRLMALGFGWSGVAVVNPTKSIHRNLSKYHPEVEAASIAAASKSSRWRANLAVSAGREAMREATIRHRPCCVPHVLQGRHAAGHHAVHQTRPPMGETWNAA